MKKLFLGAMALLAAVTLVACGSKKDAYESIKDISRLSATKTMVKLSVLNNIK